MEQIVVYKRDGNVREVLHSQQSAIFVTGAIREVVLMASDTVTLTVLSKGALGVTIGDYIIIDSEKYRMNQVPSMVKNGADLLEYRFVFESSKYDLANVAFLLPDETKTGYYTGSLREFVQLIVNNANRVYPNMWTMNIVLPEYTKMITRDLTDGNCLAALQSLCEELDFEFRIEESNGKHSIKLLEKDGGSNIDYEFRHGNRKGLYNVTREATSSEDVVTRMYVYGSSENLNVGYRHNRLCMPNKGKNQSFIDEADDGREVDAKDIYGVKEGFYIDDDIKPSMESSVTAIEGTVTADNCNSFYDVPGTDHRGMDFDLNAEWAAQDWGEYCAVRGYDPNDEEKHAIFTSDFIGKKKYLLDKAHITFNTGDLMGMNFEILSYDHETHKFVLKKNEEHGEDDTTIYYPNENCHMAVGDVYVITDISLPYSRVEEAEEKLQEKAQEYFNEKSQMLARYSIQFDNIFVNEKYPGGITMIPGDYLHVVDSEVGINKYIKVERFIHDLLNEEYSVDVTDIKKRKKGDIPDYVSMNAGTEYYREIIGGTRREKEISLSSVITANYNGNANSLHIGGGVFKDETAGNMVWNVYAQTINDLENGTAYHLYIKYSLTNDYAEIIKVPSNVLELWLLNYFLNPQSHPGFGCRLIGTITEPRLMTGRLTSKRLRKLSLIYGQADISGNDIVGGDIYVVDDNNAVVFDTYNKSARLNTLNIRRGTSGHYTYPNINDVLLSDEASIAVAMQKANDLIFGKRFMTTTLVPNDNDDPSCLSWDDGVFECPGVSELNRRWVIQASSINDLDPAIDYYMYVKVEMDGSSATIIAETEPLDHDEDGEYYYVLCGVLGAADAGGVRSISGEIAKAQNPIDGGTIVKGPSQLFKLNTEIDSARGARKAITGSLNGSYNLKDEHNHDISIQDVLGVTPTTVGGIRKRMISAETTIGDANSGLVKAVATVNTRIGDVNSGMVQKINQIIDSLASVQDTFREHQWGTSKCEVDPHTGTERCIYDPTHCDINVPLPLEDLSSNL